MSDERCLGFGRLDVMPTGSVQSFRLYLLLLREIAPLERAPAGRFRGRRKSSEFQNCAELAALRRLCLEGPRE